jgi:hypothetical protein
VDGVVAIAPQSLRNDRRQSVIDQESHGAASGSSRSLTASAAYFKAS